MKEDVSFGGEKLPEEFGKLKRRDQMLILERLPTEVKDAFQASLDSASVEVRTPLSCKESGGNISEAENSWLGACLDPEARRKHPGLRRDFIMTQKVRSILKAALLSDMADHHEHTSSLSMAGRDGAGMQSGRPSLVARINDFLAGLAGRR